jgi:hypothetical protein
MTLDHSDYDQAGPDLAHNASGNWTNGICRG